MGLYAGIMTEDNKIHVYDPEILASGIEEIFRQGGMMNLNEIRLFGKTIHLLLPIEYDDNDRLVVSYNYFENDCREDAIFDRNKTSLWSGEIGYSQFSSVVTAAYLYESFLHKGISAVHHGMVFCLTSRMTGWINYVLHTEFRNDALDPWPLFELFHRKEPDRCKTHDWKYYKGLSMISSLGYYEVQSVLTSSEEVISELHDILSDPDSEINYVHPLSYFERVKCSIQNYKAGSNESPEKQCETLLQAIRLVQGRDFWSEEIDESLRYVLCSFMLCDSAVFYVKVLSEKYGQNFWELWDVIRDTAFRKPSIVWQEYYRAVEPVTTEDFFKITGDDRIFWWTEANPIQFSPALQNWFAFLKEEYQNILSEGSSDYSFADIVQLLNDAEQEYGNLFVFESLFEESVEHLHDRKYSALWKLFDALSFDDEFQEKALVLFESPKQNQRNQKEYKQKREEMRIEMLRRFYALAANTELRKSIFGF